MRVFSSKYLFVNFKEKPYLSLITIIITLILLAGNFLLMFYFHRLNNINNLTIFIWLGIVFMPIFINNFVDMIYRIFFISKENVIWRFRK